MSEDLERAEPEPLTPEQRAAFLDYIGEHKSASVMKACLAVGITRPQVKHLRRTDEQFDAEYHDARGRGPEAILAEMRRRGIDGVDEPVFHNGEVVGEIRKYSDRLLLALGKGFVPELRDRVEVSGPQGAPVPVEVNGQRVTGISDVFELARQLGIGIAQGARDELGGGAARPALPAAEDVLPDPPAR